MTKEIKIIINELIRFFDNSGIFKKIENGKVSLNFEIKNKGVVSYDYCEKRIVNKR